MAKFKSKVSKLTKELGITKAEFDDFKTKATNTYNDLEAMLAREHGTSATYTSLVRDYNKIGDPYYSNVFVRKSVDLIAGNIASVKIVITDLKGNPVPENSPVQKLFNYINNEDSQYDFSFEFVRSLQRFGDFWNTISDEDGATGLPSSIEILMSDKVKAHLKDGVIDYWEYQMTNGSIKKFKPEDLLFTKYRHPKDPYIGLAPGSAAKKEILQDFFAQTYNIKNFQNGAMGKGSWVDPNGRNLTPAQKEEAQFAVDNEFNRGVDGAGQTVVMSRKLDWVRTSENNKDLEFIQLLNKMRDDILVAYGIPKVLFTSSEATFTNLKEAKKLFWNQTLIPIIRKIEESFNTNFFTLKRLPYKLTYDLSAIPELQEDIAEKMIAAQAMYAMNVPMSIINEVLGLGLPEDGWEGWDQPPTPTFAFDEEIEEKKAIEPEEYVKEYAKQLLIENEKRINNDDFYKQREYAESLRLMLAREKLLKQDVLDFYKEIWEDKILPFLTKEDIKSFVKDDVSESWTERFIKYLRNINLTLPFFTAIEDNIERTFNQGVFRTYSGLGIDFTQTNERTLAYLANRSLKLKDSPEVVKEAIINMLESEAFTIDEMAKAIENKWKEASLGRAKVVAVTETTVAYSAGREEGMKELGIKNKQWIHSHDVKVRSSHRINDIVPVGEEFILADGYRVRYPGDGDPAHSANCRCVLVSVL